MKNRLALLLLLLCGCAATTQQASRHVGEDCTLTGTVASVHVSRGTVFLDFDQPYPHQSLTVVSFHGQVPAAELKRFAHHTVRVTGRVTRYKGTPEIVLHRLDQLTLVR